jgi:hypothetical protein
MTAFEEHADVTNRFSVSLGRGQAGDAGAEASLDVVLQTRTSVVAIEIHGAGGDEEVPVDEIGDAISKRGREVRAKVKRAILAQSSGDIDAGVALGDGELYVGITLVVAKKDVVTGLLLLDEVIFEGECLALVVDDDVLDVNSITDQGTCLGVRHGGFDKIGPYPRSEALGLADVDDFAVGVLIEVHAWLGGEGTDFFVKVHGCLLFID